MNLDLLKNESTLLNLFFLKDKIIFKIINSTISLIILLSSLFSFSISPYIELFTSSDTELYAQEHITLNYINIGFLNKYSYGNLSIESKFSYHLYDCLNQRPNDLNPYQGYGNIENSPGLSDNQFNFFDTSVSLIYKKNKTNLYLRKSSPTWGPGEYPIFISDKSPSFLNFGYTFSFTDKLLYEHMHGSLNSGIQDPIYETLYYDENYSVFTEVPRSIAAHRLIYAPNDYFEFSVVEIIVYGGRRSIDPYYMLPLVPFLPIQTFLGDIDNDMIGFYFINSNKTYDFYCSLLIDEWSPSYTFKKRNKNWAVYQLGISKELTPNDIVVAEYTYSDNRVFRHRFEVNDYYSYGYPVGFWAGPHSDNLLVKYTQDLEKFFFSVGYNKTRRGDLDKISRAKYNGVYIKQFSGSVEKKEVFHFEVGLNLDDKKIQLSGGYKFIDWKNPMDSSFSGYPHLVKNDIYFKINYNFKEYSIK